MHLTIADSFLSKLETLQKDYEERTQVSLDTTPQPAAISLFFGKKDINTRLKQISFIKNWLTILAKELKPDLKFTSEQEVQAHILSLRVLVAVTLYLRAQIAESYIMRSSNYAVLKQLLDEALCLSNKNIIDEETYACSILAAQRLLYTHNLQTINSQLSKENPLDKHAYISEREWRNFTIYINNESNQLEKTWRKEYPITSFMMPLFAIPMQAAGNSMGWLLGDLTAKSYSLLPARHAVTALFGSGLILIMGAPASTGIMLLAPTYAGRLFDTFFGVSLAYVLGSIMRLLGNGIGWGVGMTLDISLKLLCSACSVMMSSLSHQKQFALTGFNLANGHRIIDGIKLNVVELAELEKLSKDYEAHPIAFHNGEDGFTVKIGDDEAKIKWQPLNDEPAFLQELKVKLLEKQTLEIEAPKEEQFAAAISQ